MRRIVIWLASTVTVVVLLFGYHTSTNATEVATGTAASSDPSRSATSSSGSPPAQSTTKKKTYTGQVTQTRWGPVQVQITVAGDTITAVTVLQSPSGNPRDVEINDRALPILVQSTLTAQSAKIDMVSGATVTSTGYVGSLQSALDAAGI